MASNLLVSLLLLHISSTMACKRAELRSLPLGKEESIQFRTNNKEQRAEVKIFKDEMLGNSLATINEFIDVFGDKSEASPYARDQYRSYDLSNIRRDNFSQTSKNNETYQYLNDVEDIILETDDTEETFTDQYDHTVKCQVQEEVGIQKSLPRAVIIGTRKSGTRALLEFLSLHPGVMGARTETHFYDKHWNLGVPWYLDQLPGLMSDQICLEKTPGYFHTPGVPLRIKSTKNDTKLLVIVRNPLDRLVSDYNQFRTNKLEKNLTYPDLENLVLDGKGKVVESWPPVQRSIYHKDMARWLHIFPRHQFLIIDGDRFIQEPWRELYKVENFLELPHLLTRENFYFNSTKGFYCGKRTVINSNTGQSCLMTKCLGRSKGRPSPLVTDKVATALRDFFKPHNQEFFELINESSLDWRR